MNESGRSGRLCVWAPSTVGSCFAVFCKSSDALPALTGGDWQNVAER